jgi:flagellar biogenesis protein FliO
LALHLRESRECTADISGRTVIKFASLKLAFIALLLVFGGLLLMRMVMMPSNDN